MSAPSARSPEGVVITLTLNHLKSFLQKKRLLAIQEGKLDPNDVGTSRMVWPVGTTARRRMQGQDNKHAEEADGEEEEDGHDEDDVNGNGNGHAHEDGRRRNNGSGRRRGDGGELKRQASALPAAQLLALLAASGPG